MSTESFDDGGDRDPRADYSVWDTAEATFCKFALGVLLLDAVVAPLLWNLGVDPIAVGVGAGVIGGSAMLCGSIFWGTGWVIAKRVRRISGGACLYRWRYSPEEWSSFHDTERDRIERTRRSWWKPALVIAALTAAATLIAVLADSTAMWVFVIVLGVTAVGFAAVSWGTILVGQSSEWRSRRQTDTLIDEQGILFNRRYYWLLSFGSRVEEGRIVDGSPSYLELRVRQQAGETSAVHEHRIPIPHGAEFEAQDVIARFTRQR